MKYLAIALATAALTGAQTPAISIRPNPAGLGGAEAPKSKIGVPILGYLVGPGPLELRTVTGTGKSAHVGGLVNLPSGVKRMFVPPREHYVLLDSSAAEPLSLWVPYKGGAEGTLIPGALIHPDSVSFSARGDAAVVYSKSVDRLQVISGLPAEPTVTPQLGIAKFGEVANFAVSDDGAALVVTFADGTAISSLHRAEWQPLPAAFNARALSFVPRTHNLVLNDAAQQTLILISNVGEKTQGSRMLAPNVVADRLAFTKEGDTLLAASSQQGKLWTVDLKSMTAGPVAAMSIDTLLPLRDGHTFLLSSPGVSLLNVPADRDSAVGFVPVTR